jgi:hypothetical protein
VSLNGKAYPRAERGLADDGAAAERERPCCNRLPNGGHCTLADKHAGDCDGPPPRYDQPQRPVDHKVMAKPAAPRAPAPAATEVVWPSVGSKFLDVHGRLLTITEICPSSPNDRHIVGLIGILAGDTPAPYACSRMVFDAKWRAIV